MAYVTKDLRVLKIIKRLRNPASIVDDDEIRVMDKAKARREITRLGFLSWEVNEAFALLKLTPHEFLEHFSEV